MAQYFFLFLLLSLMAIFRNSKADISQCSMTLRYGRAQCYEIGAGGFCCGLSCKDKDYGTHCCWPDKGWNKKLPSCVSNSKDLSSCRMTVRSGYASCATTYGNQLTCQFVCDGRGQINHCLDGRGWTKELPHCISSVKVSNPCSLALRNGSAVCEEVGPGKISCTVICDDRPQGFYSCSTDQGWNRELPYCASVLKDSDQRCSLLMRNGTAACHDEKVGKIACNILCDGKFQGLYRCTKGQGWDKQLPLCVSDV